MLYLYILTKNGELTDEARTAIQRSHPRHLGRSPKILGALQIENELPREKDAFVEETCLQVCQENGIGFNPARDDIAFSVFSLGDAQYGVCRIIVERYVSLPVYIAGVVAFAFGLGLGVSSASVWLLALGLGGFVLYLRLRGEARNKTEGWVFAASPVFIMSWLAGFVVHGIAF